MSGAWSRGRVRAYRRLLATYPAWWRMREADVVIGTLLEVHAARGRTRPSAADLASFALDGLRLTLRSWLRPDTKAPLLPAMRVAGHVFDQGNGALVERVVPEREQVRANAAALRDTDEQRVEAVAFVGMNLLAAR